MAALVIIAVVLLVVVIAVFYLGTLFGSKQEQVLARIPGMNPTNSEDGNMPDITVAGSLHEFLVKLHTKYGHVATFWYGKTHVISLASAKAFKDTNKLFDRPAVLFNFVKPLIGPDSIQYANEEDGKRRRHDYDQSFSYDAIKNYYSKFYEATDAVVAKIESLSSDEHINITEHMSLLVLKALSHATYGDFFKDDEKAITMLRHYETAMAILNQDISKDTEAGQRFAQALKTWHDFIRAMIQHRRDNPPNDDDWTFIDVLMAKSSSEEELISDATSYFIAGYHTTAFMMVWTFYYMCENQEVQEKIYQEIIEVIGKDEQVNYVNLESLKYMRCVFDESMRCSVLAPFAARVNMHADMVVQGYTIPKGTPVVHALGVVLMDDEIWSEPERFIPERFLPENVSTRHPFSFQPFGFAGKRKYDNNGTEMFIIISLSMEPMACNFMAVLNLKDTQFGSCRSDNFMTTTYLQKGEGTKSSLNLADSRREQYNDVDITILTDSRVDLLLPSCGHYS
uniref:Cytochrome P450 20A1-like n=1 Tax=Saccoglossus kowalevskii TaxID=10224 RepID=A0ABM0MPD9_SACKO|nr:PREDICTED: cytochrome P450 20A1-like [Saccoglossus kowalevskii]